MDETALSESGRIQQLLDDVRELSPGPAWERVEELVKRLLAMQGEGFARLLSHARAAGANGELDGRIVKDELLASLLLLHGLHPLPARDRVLAALEELRPRLAGRGARAELIAISDGIARLRLSAVVDGAREAVRRAVEDAAPELSAVEVETPEQGLVSLNVARSAP
jgi:hypothetical protein